MPDRTKHRHGLLVLTEDEIETCIGADCGAREFPDQYDALRKSFNVRRARAAHMVGINEHQARVSLSTPAKWTPSGTRSQVAAGADKCQSVYSSMCPESVREYIPQPRPRNWRFDADRAGSHP